MKLYTAKDLIKAIAFGFGICHKEGRAPFNKEMIEFIASIKPTTHIELPTDEDIWDKAKEMEKGQNNAKINTAIKEFETLKSKANSLKDVMYLDGVLAVLDSIKNETYGGAKWAL